MTVDFVLEQRRQRLPYVSENMFIVSGGYNETVHKLSRVQGEHMSALVTLILTT